jgi:hypothetical protein
MVRQVSSYKSDGWVGCRGQNQTRPNHLLSLFWSMQPYLIHDSDLAADRGTAPVQLSEHRAASALRPLAANEVLV